MNTYGGVCGPCDLDLCDPGLIFCGPAASPRQVAAGGDVGWDATIKT